jgi:hypothetical protein
MKMKTNLPMMTFVWLLLGAGAVHAQTQPGGAVPPVTAPIASVAPPPADGPLPPTPSMAPTLGAPVPIDVAEGRLYAPTNEGKFMFGVNWDVGIPIGSANTFSSNVSAVGFELLLQYWATSHITAGISMDWQTYWDTKPRTTYEIENGAVTATADNSIQNGATRAIGRYYFLDQGLALPYAGANIGLGWSTFQTAASSVALYDNTLSILLGGELGVAFVPAPNAPLLNLGARYTTLPAANFLAVTNVQSITFQVGILTP